jgi:hypothetical protein
MLRQVQHEGEERLPKANELVQWTNSSDERPELRRQAGTHRHTILTLSVSKGEDESAIEPASKFSGSGQ